MASSYVFTDPRTLNNVLMQFIAIRVGTIGAVGHLTTLRGLSSKDRIAAVLGFIILPTVPLVALLYRIVLCGYVACTRRWPADKWGYVAYLFSAMLDVKATAHNDIGGEESGIDLLEVSYQSLQRVSPGWGLRKVARVIMLVSLLAQSLASTIICLRRLSLKDDMLLAYLRDKQFDFYMATSCIGYYLYTTVATFDMWNMIYALGGIVTTITSLVISVNGWNWELDENALTGRVMLPSIASVFRQSLLLFSFLAANFYYLQSRGGVSLWFLKSEFFYLLAVPIATIAVFFGSSLAGISAVSTWLYLRTDLPGSRRSREIVISHSASKTTSAYLYTLGTLLFSLIFYFSITDMKVIQSCIAGEGCTYPLYLWKDPWSDKLWTY
jgi:hypothetical protein